MDIDDNKLFKCFTFPGGEIGLKWEEDPHTVYQHRYGLTARINSGNDLLKLITVVNALKNNGMHLGTLTIPYFPGARQDRVSNAGEPITVKVYADVINSLNADEVHIVDPHSDVCPTLINNCNVLPIDQILREVVEQGQYDTILIPDAGAAKKTFSYYFPDPLFNQRLTFVQCLKKRDTVTGKLSGFRVVDEIEQMAKCLIVDDIIDGAGTFLGLADEIRKQNNIQKISLYGTHGIFSKGVDIILKKFHKLYTTDSIKNEYDSRVRVFQI